MHFKTNFSLFCIVLIFASMLCVSASENITDLSADDESIDTPVISVNKTVITTGEEIEITLTDANKNPIANKNLTANINNKNHTVSLNSNGAGNLKLDLPANKYVLKLMFLGDENHNAVNQTFNINVVKINSVINPITTTVINGNDFSITLTDVNNNPISNGEITFNFNGKNYNAKTDSKGKASFKLSSDVGRYSVNVFFKGNDYYSSISKTILVIVPVTTSIVIGNNILLTNGYLRIYLKSSTFSAISYKQITVTVDGKKFTKTTNSEGIVVFKPNVGVGNHNIEVKFDGTEDIVGSASSKSVSGIKGDVKNPLKSKIPLRGGVPDVDYMPANYVMAADDMTYTLTKAQYREVIKRDSYCIYLNKKLSKYTFFKSKSEPKLNHIIKREKWNVIERAINTKIVKANKKNYWPSQITVSLKGKSYTYAEVRDEQNNGYTCAPTSASMCSQVLRNYICEKQFAKQAGTKWGFGTKCPWIKKALEKNHFKCSYFTKKTFTKALNQLKKGGCALIFHTWNHYVAIIDISKDGKKVLVSNSYGSYDRGCSKIGTKWITTKFMKTRFNNYDTRSLVVKLKYNLSKSTKKQVNNFYSSMGTKWTRQNTSERIPQIGK